MARAKTFIADGKRYLMFRSPGCQSAHMVTVPTSPFSWGFNEDLERPTLTPSVLVSYDGPNAGEDLGGGDVVPPARCHSFVKGGRIQFLADSTHALAGQTVDMPDIEAAP